MLEHLLIHTQHSDRYKLSASALLFDQGIEQHRPLMLTSNHHVSASMCEPTAQHPQEPRLSRIIIVMLLPLQTSIKSSAPLRP